MSRSALERIDHIRRAIARCLAYEADLDSADDHLARMAADAIERNLVVIGEAANHLPEPVARSLPQIDWAAMRGMRNVLVHEYFAADPEVLRGVVRDDLRKLDQQLIIAHRILG